jgi:hypothetical protein
MRSGRHARSKWAWGTAPSRSTERAAAVTAEERDPSKPSPGRKDRKNYCKPNRGPHTPALAKRSTFVTAECRWQVLWSSRTGGWVTGWLCVHQEECSACGRFFRFVHGDDCPDWRPARPDEQQALDAEISRRMQAWEQRKSRKPVVAGPQSYRRTRRG